MLGKRDTASHSRHLKRVTGHRRRPLFLHLTPTLSLESSLRNTSPLYRYGMAL